MTPDMACALLGIRPDATAESVKAAYRRLCLECHPDRPGGDATRFRLITDAYETLRTEGPPDADAGDVQGGPVDLPTWLRDPLEVLVDKGSRRTLDRLIGKDRASGIVAVASALLGAPDVLRSVKTKKRKKKR